MPANLRVLEKRHEPEIHVKLLVTVEQRQSRIVGNEIEFDFLEAVQHYNILHHARRRLAANAHEFEAVPVQVQRMNVVGGIAKLEPVAAPLVHSVDRFHGFHREGLAVKQPLIEATERAVILDDREFYGFVRSCLVRLSEGKRVVVDIHNETDTPEQLHWHGQFVPTDVDGAAEEGTPYIPAHGMRRIAFVPKPIPGNWSL